MEMNRNVIVIGPTHHNTLSMVRCIGKSFDAVDVILYGTQKSYIGKSRYANHVQYADNLREVLNLLIRRGDTAHKAVIISCADQVSQLLDENCAELLPSYDFFRCKEAGRLTAYMNKQAQTELAASVGLAVPDSSEYRQGGSVRYEGAFPCIVKPLESFVGGKHVSVCHDMEELRKTVMTDGAEGVSLQIQEMITKKAEIVMAGVAVDGEVIIPGYVLKRRDIVGGTTCGTVKPLGEREQAVAGQAKRMIRKIGYEGLFGFEFIDDGNEYKFVELNLRNDATCYAYMAAGANLPLTYIQMKDNPQHTCDIGTVRETTFMVEPNDFAARRTFNVSLGAWLHDWRNAQCLYLFDKTDPKPFICFFKEYIKKKLIRKKHHHATART